MKEEIVAVDKRNRQVKDYFCRYFCEESSSVKRAKQRVKDKSLKPIQVPQNVAKMLYLLAKIHKPKKILEIGTLGGYSTLWLAEAMPTDGKIITIECQEKNILVAKENFAFSRFASQIEIYQGDALEILPKLIYQQVGPFDLIFIDADKVNYPRYLDLSIQLSRSGTLILSDNLLPKRGAIGAPDPRDQEAIGIYIYNQLLADHPQLDSALFPTLVGEEGRLDALGVSLVK